jgi:ketosteroid isomerase-like protein
MTALSDQDLNHIKDLHRRWIAKELQGNESEVVELCTADVKWLVPDAPPIEGKAEIAKYLASHHVKLETIEVSDPSIEGNETIAYLTSNYRACYVSESRLAEAKGTHLWVLRKEDNEWRVAVVTWNSW